MNGVSEVGQAVMSKGRAGYTWRFLSAVCLALLIAGPSTAAEDDERWKQVKEQLFGEREIQDGAQVLGLTTPYRAQDAAVVPVDVTSKLAQTPQRHIKKLYLVIDANPSPVAAVFRFPGERAWDTISTRIRVNAYSNVRAIAETNTGEIYMTHNFVKASGGCSAPPLKDPGAAMANLGKMKLQLPKAYSEGQALLAKLLIKHPNSSGLQFDQMSRAFVPADYVRSIEVSYNGESLFSMDADISISENPAISFNFIPKGEGALEVRVKDSEGRDFSNSFAVKPGSQG